MFSSPERITSVFRGLVREPASPHVLNPTFKLKVTAACATRFPLGSPQRGQAGFYQDYFLFFLLPPSVSFSALKVKLSVVVDCCHLWLLSRFLGWNKRKVWWGGTMIKQREYILIYTFYFLSFFLIIPRSSGFKVFVEQKDVLCFSLCEVFRLWHSEVRGVYGKLSTCLVGPLIGPNYKQKQKNNKPNNKIKRQETWGILSCLYK